jgi:hypothetical protein
MRREMNILAMARGPERYVFLYDDSSHETLLEVLDRFAENPDLNFTTADAALLAQKARESQVRTGGSGFSTLRDA